MSLQELNKRPPPWTPAWHSPCICPVSNNIVHSFQPLSFHISTLYLLGTIQPHSPGNVLRLLYLGVFQVRPIAYPCLTSSSSAPPHLANLMGPWIGFFTCHAFISFSSHRCDNTFDKSNLKQEGVCLSPQLKGAVSRGRKGMENAS